MKPILRFLPYLTVIILVSFFGCRVEPEPEERVDFSSLTKAEQRQPENALAGMEVASGLEVEQFAAEPLLTNPTNMAVDARGRVWVCEANNYRLPYNLSFDERPAGDRILILEDQDGDGRADKSKVYYQGPEINAALGIAVLGNRVFVSHSPNLLVFTDEDGDDKPDRRDTLFTGIDGPDDDHGIHALIFGPDGRFYFNFGNGSHQLMQKDGSPAVDQLGRPINNTGNPYREGMAFRFDPDSSFVEVLGYNFRNNYELCVDPYGTVWQSDNDDDGNRGCRINFVMEYGNYGYKDEVTGAGWRDWRPGMHESIPKRHWHQNDPGVVPNLLQTGSGSPAGITYYTTGSLTDTFHHSMIHCEALHNVVRSYPTQVEGAGYRAGIVNLLKSEDQWFRPSDVAVAPDGSVLISDWYDPGVGGNKMDDIQRGRIYRVAPRVDRYRLPKIRLNNPKRATEALLNPNMDVFYQAWTKLRDWGAEAEPALQKLWRSDDPGHAAKALWLLARIPDRTQHYIEASLDHANPDLRITGLRVARQLDPANMAAYVDRVVHDESSAVRREAAIALRHLKGPEADRLWAELALQYDGRDRWYLEALGLGSDLYPESRFAVWKDRIGAQWKSPGGQRIVWRMRAPETVELLTEIIADPEVDATMLPVFFRGLHFKPGNEKEGAVARLVTMEHPYRDSIARYVLGQVEPGFVQRYPQVRRTLLAYLPEIKGSQEWFSAVENLRLKKEAPQLLDYFLHGEKPERQSKAGHLLFDLNQERLLEQHLRKLNDKERKDLYFWLGQVQHPGAIALLESELAKTTDNYPLQVQLVQSLGNTWDGQKVVFKMLQSGQLTGELKNTAALKLMNSWNPDIRTKAPDYLTSAKGKEGMLPPVYELVTQIGNIENGKKVFDQFCATCHRIGNAGMDFGPDLSAIGSKLAREAIYSSILYPNAGINFGYEGYILKLKDGTQVNGIITSETDDEVSIKLVGGTVQQYNRSDIASMEPMDQSLMTANLQAVIGERQLVDLVEYLDSMEEGKEEEVQ